MRIHKEGYLVVVLAILIWLGVNFLVSLTDETLIKIIILLATTPVLFLAIRFFRYPHRVVKQNPAHLLSPADGTIVAIEEVMENEILHEKRLQISIFMSVFNVHANWFPVNGTVKHVSHNNGRFMAAYLPKSSTENERSAVVVTTKNGVDILARQIAGAMARRIVTYAKVGEKCHVDEQMGFIKFGSRVDVYLPLDSEVLIEMDQKVTGNQTPIARLHTKK